MLIDTHCHLNFNAYKDDVDAVLNRALDADVWVINVGSQQSTSERAIALAEKHDQGVYAIVGLHPVHLFPSHVDESEQGIDFRTRGEGFEYELYKQLAQHEKVVGIGEMGLDYFHMPQGIDEQEVKRVQYQAFEQGIALAQELQKPLTIHTRPTKNTYDAYDEVLAILKQQQCSNAVVHCFSGTLDQAKALLDHGCLLSFTGIVTFKNAQAIHEIAQYTPFEQMMLETDAPYLSPTPHRGERNEPVYTQFIAEHIARLKNVTVEEVAQKTTTTARKFFGI